MESEDTRYYHKTYVFDFRPCISKDADASLLRQHLYYQTDNCTIIQLIPLYSDMKLKDD